MIDLIKAAHILSAFSRDPVMAQVAKEVEEIIIRMIWDWGRAAKPISTQPRFGQSLPE